MNFSLQRGRRALGRIPRSYLYAAGIGLAAAAWMLTAAISSPEPPAGELASIPDNGDKLMAVRVRDIVAEPYTRSLVLRGHSAAVRSVRVKAQTASQVVAVPVEKGNRVEKGELLCRLSPGSREAELAEAKALARQRELEYDAAIKLAAKGHRSETQAAAAAAALDAAKAQVAQMETELGYTRITAPFAGVVDSRPVDVGDYMQKGDVCVHLVDEDPFLFVAHASESEVGLIEPGRTATAKMLDGRRFTGRIRFVAKTANERTRTFRVELEVPNTERDLREGLTSELHIPVDAVQAHFISPALLVLDDEGRVGVRTVDSGDRAQFHAVDILEDTADGVWITGLPEQTTLITVGQEFVKDGQKIRVQYEDGAAGT